MFGAMILEACACPGEGGKTEQRNPHHGGQERRRNAFTKGLSLSPCLFHYRPYLVCGMELLLFKVGQALLVHPL